ncbi:DUF1648 domain-containing protein [Virgibacillus sp. W0430]|uniref:DUF1648 domain-containing protein n=1 Tax=Virgibacillus sp. W0430 TaxID=3391580 RepID=UPI003F48DCEB
MERPKIKIPKTRGEWFCDSIGYSLYIGSILFLAIIWTRLPETVPVHFNALGEVDRWGSRLELLILPGIGTFILALMQTLEKFPETHNYPKRFNKLNAKAFYLNSRKMVNQVKNICLVIFTLILFESVSIALGWGNGFGKLFLSIAIMSSFIPILFMIVRQKKIK